MMQMDESRNEIIRQEAKKAKAIAVEKYKAGDLAGAKEFALKAKEINPDLCGLLRLNAVLDLRMGFEKQNNNGEVDWYSVLAVEPTEDLETILYRCSKLAMAIVNDKDDSVGSTQEAKKILADAWTYFDAMRKVVPPPRVADPVSKSRMIISGEGSKQKGPPSTNPLHVPKLRKTRKDAGIKRDGLELNSSMVDSALVEKAMSMIKLNLERFASSSPHKNVAVAAAAETKTLQGLKKCEEAKRVKTESKETDNVE